MGIFRNITRALKKAAPLIGSTIGFALGGPAGAAIGSGLGSLAAGQDADDALKNAALAYGIGSLGKAAGFTQAPEGATGISRFLPGRQVANMDFGTKIAPNFGIGASNAVPMTEMLKSSGNPIFKFIGENPLLTASAGIGALGLGALGEEEEGKATARKERPYPEGTPRLGQGLIDGMSFDLNNKEERDEYFRRVRAKQGFEEEFELAAGGEVQGPGTGTSDSVPARLSDGEFVLTAKAVRGAGGGDRDVGAARMYDMMSELERVA
tara:strand:- start:28 stop:825 length:798 start_codon:yes stop_codon:yes gene_type:complete